ncbi:MAG TPA: carboxypeptidase-like regulatory domain-containing protein, partial [Lacibacter sp.]|nr:carboxypeptidase-like regulatory domain-containing protein [Lacibacter sp.]
MKKITLNLIILFIAACSFAQSPVRGKITTTILNQDKKPVENATAELLRSKDSSLVKTALSDKAGLVEFERISFGSYIIRTSHVNHEKQFSSVITVSENQTTASAADVVLQPSATQLKTIE